MLFADFSKHYLAEFNSYMYAFLSKPSNQVEEAMLYSLQAGGKRIRPLLLLGNLQAFNKEASIAFDAATALEWIHTYSLIHDDLPAIDNDDLRRGKASNHKVYGEATAILAGDGLLTQAFSILSQSSTLDVELKLDLIQALADAAGTSGMIGGQIKDIQAEQGQVSLEALEEIHAEKTGALIRYAFYAGARIAKQDPFVIELLDQLAQHIGLAFQIRDDLLDVVGDSQSLGKNVGQDEKLEKSTYPSLLGLDQAYDKLDQELDGGLNTIQTINQIVENFDAELFSSFIDYLRLKKVEQ